MRDDKKVAFYTYDNLFYIHILFKSENTQSAYILQEGNNSPDSDVVWYAVEAGWYRGAVAEISFEQERKYLQDKTVNQKFIMEKVQSYRFQPNF